MLLARLRAALNHLTWKEQIRAFDFELANCWANKDEWWSVVGLGEVEAQCWPPPPTVDKTLNGIILSAGQQHWWCSQHVIGRAGAVYVLLACHWEGRGSVCTSGMSFGGLEQCIHMYFWHVIWRAGYPWVFELHFISGPSCLGHSVLNPDINKSITSKLSPFPSGLPAEEWTASLELWQTQSYIFV